MEQYHDAMSIIVRVALISFVDDDEDDKEEDVLLLVGCKCMGLICKLMNVFVVSMGFEWFF